MAKKKAKIEEEVKEEKEIEEVEEVVSSSEDEEDEYVELTTEERIVNIEKKTNLILVLVAIITALSLITMIVVINGGTGKTDTTTQEQEGSSSSSSSYDTSAFKEIKAQDIASESKKETIVVMIGRQGCGYCAYYAPILTQVADAYGITVRYIDYLKMVTLTSSGGQVTDTEAYEIIKNMDAVADFKGAGETALKGTPATLIIKDSKILYYIKGAADAETVAKAFEAVGLGK